MYATNSTLLQILRNSTESSPVWLWHPAILLFKLCTEKCSATNMTEEKLII